jgi:feruloyl-CoA synthase
MTPLAARRDDPQVLFATPEIVADHRVDGSILLKSTAPLRQGARCVGDWLEHWARQTPDRVFLGERGSVDAPWTTVTYKDALGQVRATAAWILAQGLSAERPLVILSDNSIDHALIALAAMHVSVPSAAISPAYSLMSRDFDKLKRRSRCCNRAIYVSGTAVCARSAIQPLRLMPDRGNAEDADVITSARSLQHQRRLMSKQPCGVTPDTIANSCSPGLDWHAESRINTQRMLTRAAGLAQTWRSRRARDP